LLSKLLAINLNSKIAENVYIKSMRDGWYVRHDKGTQEGDGIAGGSLAIELGYKHSLQHITCRGLYVTHFPKETASHYEHQHCYQQFQLPNLACHKFNFTNKNMYVRKQEIKIDMRIHDYEKY